MSVGLPHQLQVSVGLPHQLQVSVGLPHQLQVSVGLPHQLQVSVGLPHQFQVSVGLVVAACCIKQQICVFVVVVCHLSVHSLLLCDNCQCIHCCCVTPISVFVVAV